MARSPAVTRKSSAQPDHLVDSRAYWRRSAFETNRDFAQSSQSVHFRSPLVYWTPALRCAISVPSVPHSAKHFSIEPFSSHRRGESWRVLLSHREEASCVIVLPFSAPAKSLFNSSVCLGRGVLWDSNRVDRLGLKERVQVLCPVDTVDLTAG